MVWSPRRPRTPIFTPTVSGKFRISTYATLTQADPKGGALWQVILGWRDAGGPTTTIEASAGVPTTISMVQGGTADNSGYSLFYVVEQIGKHWKLFGAAFRGETPLLSVPSV